MKRHLLILLSLAVYVRCQLPPEMSINVIEQGDGIKLTCVKVDPSDPKKIESINVTGEGINQKELELSYRDDNTGEYGCKNQPAENQPAENQPAIFVKFRTCDSCVELDIASVVGMAIGNLVASVVVGVAVYLIASQSPTAQSAPTKKRSDRQNLIPNEASGSGSGNDHYQRLRHKQPKDEYDVLRK